MEGRANAKVSDYMTDFKLNMQNYVNGLGCSNENKSGILQQIYNYDPLEFTKEDFAKRKRVKNIVPKCDRCCAKRANGDQCTRKRRDSTLYCGTHVKGIPHGSIESISKSETSNIQIELVAQEIKGILYYLDDTCNVYKTEDVLHNKVNPSIIASYLKDEHGNYSIPDFNI
jgi:hypothetical protein